MDLDHLKSLNDADLKAEIQRLSRSQMDDDFRWLGAQRAILMQKLEAVLGNERQELFASLRPGGLDDIDAAIRAAKPNAQKEIALLTGYRDLNRVLNFFMDAYEQHVLDDVQHLPPEELRRLAVKVDEQIKITSDILKQPSADYRKAQDASGTFRLATLVKAAIQKALGEGPGDF